MNFDVSIVNEGILNMKMVHLTNTFKIGIIPLLPIFVLFILSFKKVPAEPTMIFASGSVIPTI